MEKDILGREKNSCTGWLNILSPAIQNASKAIAEHGNYNSVAGEGGWRGDS